jgi:hypothetical protein
VGTEIPPYIPDVIAMTSHHQFAACHAFHCHLLHKFKEGSEFMSHSWSGQRQVLPADAKITHALYGTVEKAKLSAGRAVSGPAVERWCKTCMSR